MKHPRPLAALVAVLVATLVPSLPAAAATDAGMTRRLGDSTDVIEAAIDLSAGAWDDGAASIVVLGRADLFPDSLAGAALAGTDGPVLFTTGGPTATLVTTVRAEIERVLPAPNGCDGSGEIDVLGGTGAISLAAETELAELGYCVHRLGGANRVETAVRIAERVRDRGGDLSTILLSRSDTWPDSATGSAYAAATGHPILVTSPTALDPAVATFLAAAGPDDIVLLGGTAALAPGVAEAASAYGTTTRVAGASRDATAVAIARRLWAPLAPRGVVFVNGFAANGWAYAIAGAVNAAIDGAAELYVQADAIPESVADHLDSVDDEFTLVSGPVSLVSDDVVAAGEASRGMATPPGLAPLRYRDEVFDSVEQTADVEYGRAADLAGVTQSLVMDVYEPAGDVAVHRPTIVWVHGGGFYAGTRNQESSFFTEWVRHGFVVATIDYRMIPSPGCVGGPLDLCVKGIQMAVDDAQTAVRYLRANASRFGVDADRIAMSGHSAGGMTAMDAAFASAEEPASAIQAAVSLAGFAATEHATAGDAPTLLFNAEDDPIVMYDWAATSYESAIAAGLTSFLTTWATGGHSAYQSHVDQVIDESTSFLWWQLDLEGAER